MPKIRVIRRMILTFRLALFAGFAYTVLYGMHRLPGGKDVEAYLMLAALATAIFTIKCAYHTTRFVRMELQPNRQPSEQ